MIVKKVWRRMFTKLIKFILIISHLVIGTCCALYILYINNMQKNISLSGGHQDFYKFLMSKQ